MGLAATGLSLAAPVEARVSAVATFSVLADIAHQISGDRVDITTLVGPNGDVHIYQPIPSDAGRLSKAGLLIENGLGLEGWVDRLREASGFSGPVVIASSGVAALSGPDPHAWQDVGNAEIYADNITAGLVAADPADGSMFRTNLAQYRMTLLDLDRWIRERIGTVPPDKRRIITSHDAFDYFGHAYGIRFTAPVGMTEDSDPSAGAVAALIRQIREEGTRAIFIENMTDPRLIERIAAEAGGIPGGTLYADALSGPNGQASTYVAMMRSNVMLMVKAMQQN